MYLYLQLLLNGELLAGHQCRDLHYGSADVSAVTSHMVHSHTVHLPLGARLSLCTMCRVAQVSAVTTGVRRFLRKTNYRQMHLQERRPLFVTHCTRDDIVLAYLAHYQKNKHHIDVRRAAFGRGARVSASWLGSLVISKGEDGSGVNQGHTQCTTQDPTPCTVPSVHC